MRSRSCRVNFGSPGPTAPRPPRGAHRTADVVGRQRNGISRQTQLTSCGLRAILSGCPVPEYHEAMNLTDEEIDATAARTGGAGAHRQPITDVNAWLDGLEGGVQPALRALGELRLGVAEPEAIAPRR